MSRPRRRLNPLEAPNDGARRLRERLRRWRGQAWSNVEIAKMLSLDPSGSGVARWANGDRRPDRIMREKLEEELEIPFSSWDEPNELEPSTTRREPPTTQPDPNCPNRPNDPKAD
jgi:ribosome-binding protein aMBF1 (putative translation factor)